MNQNKNDAKIKKLKKQQINTKNEIKDKIKLKINKN